MNDLLNVRIISPREIIYQGSALSVSSRNSKGKFDILARHANFLTIIENQPVEIIKEDLSTQVFNFSQAIIYSVGNRVSIYADPKTIETGGM